MNFTLDPPSGLSDSYFDVEVSLSFERADEVQIRLFNETINEPLEILGISSGYIKKGIVGISKEVAEVSCHINIFNNDKMNKMFKAYSYIVLRCEIEITRDGKTSKETETAEFYNESKSLDSSIIPVELIVFNRTVDFTNNVPLSIDLITSIAKKIELCIRSDDSKSECCIQVTCKHGKTSIDIPCEFIYHDLNLKENERKKYKFYYIRYQGTGYSRLGNKQYLPIVNTELEFKLPVDITPKPQTRIDPTGKLYGSDFTISSRYLVLCHKDYSGFTGRNKLSPQRALGWTMLLHESQHMQALNQEIKQFATTDDKAQEKIRETHKLLHEQKLKKGRRKAYINSEQSNMLSTVAGVYDQMSQPKNPILADKTKTESFAMNQANSLKRKSGNCAPCSRKRLNA